MDAVKRLNHLSKAKIQITGVANNSQDVLVGNLFLAYPGDSVDGRDYIASAINQGAAAVFWEKTAYEWPKKWQHIANWPIEGLKKQVSAIAAEVYKPQGDPLSIIGVTGTNGKTSVTQWLAKAFEYLGKESAVIGTLGIGRLDDLKAGRLTTPDAVTIHREMARLSKDHVEYIAMEVSSIGIEEGRVTDVPFRVAVFTNFTQDHLDYHHDMASYWKAKEKLFDWPTLKAAVINIDDPYGMKLANALSKTEKKVITYSVNPDHKPDKEFRCVYAQSIRRIKHIQQITVSDGKNCSVFETELIGRFNVSNLLAVLATLLLNGFEWEKVIAIISRLSPPPGRMMRVLPAERPTKEQETLLPTVIVDYAHTPAALENVAEALLPLARGLDGKLWIVFGCGGDRDQEKRSIMGKIAAKWGDRIIVTDDNPRFENPASIRKMILSGIQNSENVKEIGDRKQAIFYAIEHAFSNDVVLIAGKGHEDYQEICGIRQNFSDSKIIQESLNERIAL